MPWSGSSPPFGFGPDGSRPWLPQPAEWTALTAEAEAADPGSTLSLYREAMRIRRSRLAGGEPLAWLPSPSGTLLFARGERLRCAVNFSGAPLTLPPGRSTLLASAPVSGNALEPDAAAWFEEPQDQRTS